MKIEKDISLKEFTTFKIGGKAQFFCYIKNEDDITAALAFARENRVTFFVLGGGSNILISDEGFKGLVMKMEMKGIRYIEDGENTKVIVQAGEDWDNLVGQTVERGLHGLENLSLIPGTVGAAPVQNIGAYGSEVKDTIESVRVFDSKDQVFKDFSNKDCNFEYRNSIFKKDKRRYIIISVTFILKRKGRINIEYKDLKDYFAGKSPILTDVRSAVITIRQRKLPDVKIIGTAGSFFKNPIIGQSQARDLKLKYPDLPIYPVNDEYVKVSLAWIIDHVCNFRGVARGDVGTYKNQALVLVNNGNATAKDIKDFAKEIEIVVKEKTGIIIEPEAEYIG